MINARRRYDLVQCMNATCDDASIQSVKSDVPIQKFIFCSDTHHPTDRVSDFSWWTSLKQLQHHCPCCMRRGHLQPVLKNKYQGYVHDSDVPMIREVEKSWDWGWGGGGDLCRDQMHSSGSHSICNC